MSEDNGVMCAKYRILELLSELDVSDVDSIEHWFLSNEFRQDLKQRMLLMKSEKHLIKISDALKGLVPFNAEMLTENIVSPTVGDQADCNVNNTCHVDEFLYDDCQVEDLVKEGRLKRYYCLDCNSRNIKDLTYISHSMSRHSLQFIFKVLLPKDLEHKLLLDVGSRLGAVLYGAYYFSNASTIIGIEMNKEFCDIQEKIIDQFAMDTNRIKVIHSDITERSDLVVTSDIFVINVLDFFVDIEKHKEMWYFFKRHIRKGSYVVTNRSMANTLGSLDIFEEFMNWLSICKPNQLENEVFFDMEDNCEIFLYIVK